MDAAKGSIEKAFGITTQSPNPSVDCSFSLEDARPPELMFIPATTRIAEITGRQAKGIMHGPMPPRGLYMEEGGKLLLTRDLWCTKTLVHEILHSMSSFSTDTSLRVRLKSLYEGLTEFLTGYVLWKQFPACHSDCWPEQSGRHCSMTYPTQTRLWWSVFQFIPLEFGTELYFWSPPSSLTDSIRAFQHRIKRNGYPKFREVLLTQSSLDSTTTFRDECMRSFGRKQFNRILSRANPADMTTLKRLTLDKATTRT